MLREVWESETDEGVREFDSTYQVRRGPDGGFVECGGSLSAAFEKELDGTIRGIRGGGAGAEGAEHSSSVDETRRVIAQYLAAAGAEVASRLRSRGAREARVWVSGDGGEGDSTWTDISSVAWGHGGRVVAEVTLKINGTVMDVLTRDRGRGFIAHLCSAMWGAGAKAGVVIG